MKLSQLRPKWITLANWADPTIPYYTGVSFDCPHCELDPCPHCGKEQKTRLAITFWPHIDPTNIAKIFAVPVRRDPGNHDRVSGETFDTLTIDPSIGFDNPPHFHGHIINGEVTSTYPNASWIKD